MLSREMGTTMRRLRVGLAQINVTVGDFAGNAARILQAVEEARRMDVDILTLPELVTCGYPPEDLLFKTRFIQANLEVLNRVVESSAGIGIIMGYVDAGEDIYNAAAVIWDRKLAGVYHKMYLPNYGVFDENRYFQVGESCPVFAMADTLVGVTICEDMWYEGGPAGAMARGGAEVIVNISASPYHFRKAAFRERMLATRAADCVAIVVHTNLVGGQDELVFDGSSLVLDEHGETVARAKQFEEDLLVVDLDVESVFQRRLHDPRWRKVRPAPEDPRWNVSRKVVSEEHKPWRKSTMDCRVSEQKGRPGEVYDALVLGTRDYVAKNGLEKVAVGLSGGIDSSLVAVVAVDALGPQNVIGVAMPSVYSSEGSLGDARLLATNLGIGLYTIPIEKARLAFLDMLSIAFEGTGNGLAEENIQARIRGTLLMALSNKFGWLVLTTGNKSEMCTGYTTLYGDMAGGFAVIKDVPKTMVYELARYRNTKAGRDLVPVGVLEKPPSAELRPGQKDTDSLPAYEVLDPIITAYVEQDRSVEHIIASGLDAGAVKQAACLVDGSEYKRRQAPIGIKLTARALGRDRRLPVTNRFKGG